MTWDELIELGGKYPGKVRITSDGTIPGSRIVVLDADLREVEIRGVTRIELDAETDTVKAVIVVNAPELELLAEGRILASDPPGRAWPTREELHVAMHKALIGADAAELEVVQKALAEWRETHPRGPIERAFAHFADDGQSEAKPDHVAWILKLEDMRRAPSAAEMEAIERLRAVIPPPGEIRDMPAIGSAEAAAVEAAAQLGLVVVLRGGPGRSVYRRPGWSSKRAPIGTEAPDLDTVIRPIPKPGTCADGPECPEADLHAGTLAREVDGA